MSGSAAFTPQASKCRRQSCTVVAIARTIARAAAGSSPKAAASDPALSNVETAPSRPMAMAW